MTSLEKSCISIGKHRPLVFPRKIKFVTRAGSDAENDRWAVIYPNDPHEAHGGKFFRIRLEEPNSGHIDYVSIFANPDWAHRPTQHMMFEHWSVSGFEVREPQVGRNLQLGQSHATPRSQVSVDPANFNVYFKYYSASGFDKLSIEQLTMRPVVSPQGVVDRIVMPVACLPLIGEVPPPEELSSEVLPYDEMLKRLRDGNL